MLQNPVGLAVLAAGVGNDVVGWIVSQMCRTFILIELSLRFL